MVGMKTLRIISFILVAALVILGSCDGPLMLKSIKKEIEASRIVATPTFSPGGGTYPSAAIGVTISCGTSGASIRYTTDGTKPSETVGTLCSSGIIINVSGSVTLKAIAYQSGWTDSQVASASYIVNPSGTVATPTFSPGGGIYTSAQTVTISCATSGASIRYTTDGSQPSETAGTLCSSGTQITVSSSLTLKAIAFLSGWNDSSVASAVYSFITAPYHIPRTGQTISYASFDDAELSYGKAWPAPRFSQLADTSIQDNLTGFIWAPNGNLMAARDPSFDTDGSPGDGAVTWSHALDYIDKLNSENYLGHNDWRLPNRREMHSLTNYGTDTISWLQTFGFTDLMGAAYKTSTDCGDSGSYCMVEFWNGRERDNSKSTPEYLFPVRGESNYLPKTGQTTTTQSGDDGDLQKGISWPSPRFINNMDETITDNLTGLTWAQDANLIKYRDPSFDNDGTIGDGAVTWQHALDYAAKLRAENYLGHNDWRVPNVNELESLCDAVQWNQISLLTGAGFIHIEVALYWSSTTYCLSSDFAHTFWPGQLGIGEPSEKTNAWGVMVVRGGN